MSKARTRINPFDRGTAEHVLFDRHCRADLAAKAAERSAFLYTTEATSHRDTANRYADALRALGHGDKVPGQVALVDLTKSGTNNG
ncbi:hypothetical protein DXH95_02920 [Sphingorhabdus pulchriflava]|uniref:Uncharacterized protein n=1 Tax=Sphingorhabdus pulchriflava TaxID=2292257 RepID=A0A371BG63_9SPHN|nr:hypothetical protein [Sphingorhabdus pulchriflava]RDV06393.1 hypothetical protein DXH95_02920 [Sphingorhabdus pulchriflava]